jgi:hypothetical protein
LRLLQLRPLPGLLNLSLRLLNLRSLARLLNLPLRLLNLRSLPRLLNLPLRLLNLRSLPGLLNLPLRLRLRLCLRCLFSSLIFLRELIECPLANSSKGDERQGKKGGETGGGFESIGFHEDEGWKFNET